MCSNPECGKKDNLCAAPYFVCAYYGIHIEKRMKRVCQKCYREAENHQDILVKMLGNNKSIILGPKKPKNLLITIDDEDGGDEELFVNPEEVEIEEDIDDLVNYLVQKYNFQEQVDASLKYLGK